MLPCVYPGGIHTGGYRYPKQGNRHAALQGVKNPRICNTGANSAVQKTTAPLLHFEKCSVGNTAL